jgi:hypothetical protein
LRLEIGWADRPSVRSREHMLQTHWHLSTAPNDRKQSRDPDQMLCTHCDWRLDEQIVPWSACMNTCCKLTGICQLHWMTGNSQETLIKCFALIAIGWADCPSVRSRELMLQTHWHLSIAPNDQKHLRDQKQSWDPDQMLCTHCTNWMSSAPLVRSREHMLQTYWHLSTAPNDWKHSRDPDQMLCTHCNWMSRLQMRDFWGDHESVNWLKNWLLRFLNFEVRPWGRLSVPNCSCCFPESPISILTVSLCYRPSGDRKNRV